jgi:DNA-binding CsgD family transcriptional regulator
MREMEVFNAMADGLSTKAAARLLGVAVKTVESHRTRVFAKLGVRSQAQLVAARTGHLPEWPTTMGVP